MTGIEIWPVRLDMEGCDAFRPLLSADERRRADRFALPHLAAAFILGRAVLRVLSARYLGLAPGAVRFEYGPHGKPRFAETTGLHFNLSHSGGMGLFGFAAGLEFGLDVERLRPVRDLDRLAARVLATEEATALAALPPERREAAFLSCWTRKEAFVKAVGGGLSIPLDGFAVTVDPAAAPGFLRLPSLRAREPWQLRDIDLGPGFAAALAYPGPPRAVQVFPPCEASTLLEPVPAPWSSSLA